MKQTHIWIIVVFLLGMAIFGIFKSISLFSRNIQLAYTVSRLSNELDATKLSLQRAQGSLGEVYLKNAQLEAENKALNERYLEKKEEAQKYYTKVASLTQKLYETLEVNNSLLLRSRESGDRFIRIQLENEELKRKYTTVKGLKDAIRELKLAQRQARRVQRSKPKVAPVKQVVKPEVHKVLALPSIAIQTQQEDIQEGNGGYFVKDGKTTFRGMVNIEVVPLDTTLGGEKI